MYLSTQRWCLELGRSHAAALVRLGIFGQAGYIRIPNVTVTRIGKIKYVGGLNTDSKYIRTPDVTVTRTNDIGNAYAKLLIEFAGRIYTLHNIRLGIALL